MKNQPLKKRIPVLIYETLTRGQIVDMGVKKQVVNVGGQAYLVYQQKVQ